MVPIREMVPAAHGEICGLAASKLARTSFVNQFAVQSKFDGVLRRCDCEADPSMGHCARASAGSLGRPLQALHPGVEEDHDSPAEGQDCRQDTKAKEAHVHKTTPG